MHPLVATLYNPHTQTKQELIQGFVVRSRLFEKLFHEIKMAEMRYPEQHLLIEGQRGMGKTTLLLRLAYEIENDTETRLIPIIFEEEAYYRITRLFQLWEETAKLLAEREAIFHGLFERMSEGEDEQAERYERRSFEVLISTLQQQGRKLVLLIDNFSELCKTLDEQEVQRLREVLLTCSEIRWVGATAGTLEGSFRYQHPFYEFFKKYSLEGLNLEETQNLLLQLAQSVHQKQIIQEIITQQPGRVETLRILTGGVVRTIVLLFEVFVDQGHGKAIHDLEKILDRVTPLYKHRMDELPILQREVVSALAMNWDGMNLSELMQRLRRPIHEVEASLTALKTSHVVELKVVDTQTQWYFLQERFFNIWYLMRSATGAKTRVIWLVRFLEAWYDEKQLKDRAHFQIHALEKPGYSAKAAYFYAEALAQTGKLGWGLEYDLKQATRKHIELSDQGLARELSPADQELFEQAMSFLDIEKYEQAKALLLQIKQANGKVYFSLGYCFHFLESPTESDRYYLMAIEEEHLPFLFSEFKYKQQLEHYYLMAIDKGNEGAMNDLAILYANELNYPKAEHYYLMAVDKGYEVAMINLAVLYTNELKDYPKAEHYYLMAIGKGNGWAMINLHEWAMNSLAVLYTNELKDYPKAEHYYLMAVDKGNEWAMINLARLYEDELKDCHKAEHYYSMVVTWAEKGHPLALNFLAWDFFKKKIHQHTALCCAEQAFEKEQKDYISQTIACINVWHHHFKRAVEVAKLFIDQKDFDKRYPEGIEIYLMLLLAKQQYSIVRDYFESPPGMLKERFKPIYYAFLSLIHDQAFGRMPPELNEPVTQILAKIHTMAEDYA